MTTEKDVTAEPAFALGSLTLATARLAERREAEREQEMEWREMIRRALDAGWSVTNIASAAGCSRERVYQIRDGRR